MIDARPSRAPSRRPPARRGVYRHPVYGEIDHLKDPAIDFYAVAQVASPDAADLEGHLRRFVEEYWRWERSDEHRIDHPYFQSGTTAISSYDIRESKRHKADHATGPGRAIDEAEFVHYRTPPPYLRYKQIVDRLVTTGELTDNHLRMLELRWGKGGRDEMPLERPDEGKSLPAFTGRADAKRKLTQEQADAIRASPLKESALAREYGVSRMVVKLIRGGQTYRAIDPDQTVAGQLQVTNARARRMWAEVTVILYFELFGT